MQFTLADIKPEDVVNHVVNSLDNEDASHYVDEEGFAWVVRAARGGVGIVVEITDPEGIATSFRMVPEEI